MTGDAAGDEAIDGESESAEGGDAEGSGHTDGDESSHLDDVEDGAGCTEIWERLSERREE